MQKICARCTEKPFWTTAVKLSHILDLFSPFFVTKNISQSPFLVRLANRPNRYSFRAMPLIISIKQNCAIASDRLESILTQVCWFVFIFYASQLTFCIHPAAIFFRNFRKYKRNKFFSLMCTSLGMFTKAQFQT